MWMYWWERNLLRHNLKEKIVVKTQLTPNFPSCHLYMKIFLLVSRKYMLIAKIYLSSSPHLRRSQAKKICWITHKDIQQFSQRNSWKEMRTFWRRRKHTNMAKHYLSYLAQPRLCDTSKFIPMHNDLWLSNKLYPPILCLTNIWLWFFFIISIRIRR